MLVKIADKLTNSLVANGVIDKSEYEIYHYGFETGFSMLFNALTTVIIGFAFHMTLETLLFLAVFIPLRSYVGGYHASDHFRCYLISAVAIVVVLAMIKFVLNDSNSVIMTSVGTIFSIFIFVFAPVPDANRPLDAIEVNVYRQRARVVLIIEVFGMLILLIIGFKTAASVLFCTLCLVFLLTCAGVLKNSLTRSNREYDNVG